MTNRSQILDDAHYCLDVMFTRIGDLCPGPGEPPIKLPMLIWDFYDAPEPLQALSENGGDEDWLVVVPKQYVERIKCEPLWVMYLGSCDRDFIDVSDNYLVVIGSHS